ncbi:UDP-N-acetylmuramoyl-tripeptide--D-alanyl-D-alanine ligase [Undibacterium sp. Ji22W]|uniref:UDP-N-acetylmuramoyl-tripeptide--D-alanyl-D- alanine ligase n=1 Tax=Undibacterium sp. Ji22W TaxID=3413038 RepID=UPI003BF2D3DD
MQAHANKRNAIHGSLAELQKVVAHSLAHGEAHFSGLSTDSRQIETGNIFLALHGETFDAHDFLDQVVSAGAVAVIAEKIPAGFTTPALIVPDTKLALAEIATNWRQQFELPVIAVTGSNGKTTVKEMIASILRAKFGSDHMVSTQGNLNNDIGVPLTVFRLHAGHQAAVLELGMNHPGEIALLSAIAQASVGLVNNAQREHQEFMQTVEAVALENGAVLSSLPAHGVAVFPADDPYTKIWQELAGACKCITFGLNDSAEVHASFVAQEFGSEIEMSIQGEVVKLQLAAAGQHNVLNALAAAACCSAIGVDRAKIVEGLQAFAPVSGRLQPKQALAGARLIDDTYNANPDSVKAAIDVLAQAGDKTILVLGDMGEVGADGASFHQEIGLYAKSQGIKLLYTFGSLAQASATAFGDGAQHFSELGSLLLSLEKHSNAGNTILIKGSRFMKMERVVVHLCSATS